MVYINVNEVIMNKSRPPISSSQTSRRPKLHPQSTAAASTIHLHDTVMNKLASG